MRTAWKIAKGVLVGLLLTVYVAVALLNYSVVQSYLGTAAGRHFSREWGGTVKIGSLHVMPWDHLHLNNVLLVAPDGDTLLDVKSLRVHFKRFPYSDMHLTLDRVMLRDGYYHLAVRETGDSLYVTNLQYIIDYYLKDYMPDNTEAVFTVDVGTAMLSRMRYRMDLPEIPGMDYPNGVRIAHMDFSDIRCRAKDIHVVNDDISVRLLKFGCKEQSGFEVDQVEGRVHVSPHDITVTDFALRTPQSTVLADVSMTYGGWETMADYLNNVRHDITLKEGTTVALGDAAYWAPMLWGIDVQVEAKGRLNGTVNDMTTDMMLNWGEKSSLIAAGTLRGIEKPTEAVANIDIERFRTNVDDLHPLFALLKPDKEMERLLRQVDYVDLTGRVNGGLAVPATVNLNLGSGIGNLHADAMVNPSANGNVRFIAEVGSDGLGLDLLHTDWLSHSGFNVSVDGETGARRNLQSLRATVSGQLLNSVVRGRRLAPIALDGRIEAGHGEVQVASADSIAQLTIGGTFDLADSNKRFTCDLEVERLDLAAFKLMPEEYGLLHTEATLQANGRNLDTMAGSLVLRDSRLGDLALDQVRLTVDANQGYKGLRLTSEAVDATMFGRFSYEALPLVARHMGLEVLPSDLFSIDTLTDEERELIEHCNVHVDATWKDRGRLLHTLAPELTVAKGTRLTGDYNATERLKLTLRSDTIGFGSVMLRGVWLNGRTPEEDYVASLTTSRITIGSLELLQNTTLQLTGNPQLTTAALTWGTEQSPSSGDVALQLADGQVRVTRPNFRVGDRLWQLSIEQLAVEKGEHLCLSGDGISVSNEQQSLIATLSLMHRKNDMIALQFKDFDLSGIASILLHDSPLTVAGDVNGRFSMFGFDEIPYFNARLTIDSCALNHQSLGHVELSSQWDAGAGSLILNLASDRQIYADGTMQLGGEETPIDFTVDFNSLNMAVLQPLLSDFSSRFEGLLHGSFEVGGTLNRPVIEGAALVENGVLQVDMTGVTYHFGDSILFNNKKITLDKFRISDPRGNIAYINGEINYDELTDINLNLRLRSQGAILLLDRSKGDYYGTVLASTGCAITGPIDSMNIVARATTMPGSSLTVVVNDQRQVATVDYITFVGDETSAREVAATQKEQSLRLDLTLNITPDVRLNLPMDFSEVKVKMDATGAGTLHLETGNGTATKVEGTYEIASGNLKVGLMSVVEKNFTISPNSRIVFPGNLTDATFDLQAIYSQRVNLSSLTGNVADFGGTQKYIQVDDIIAIAGSLQNPTISFDLDLPNADPSVEEVVFAYIDRDSERDMLTQTLSLLLFNSFYNTSNTDITATATSTAASSGIGSIASLMGNRITDMVQFVDINFNYKAATDFSNQQVDFNISKDWGRWYLESTLGYGGESRELQNGSNTAIIDALVGYRLSSLVHLFAYNRTNTNDYTRMDLPYKQGIGLKLTKDFNRWSDLFKK